MPAENQAGDERGKADGVEHVVDVVAVARPLTGADTRQRAVEAVAEPVQREQRNHARDRSADAAPAQKQTPTPSIARPPEPSGDPN